MKYIIIVVMCIMLLSGCVGYSYVQSNYVPTHRVRHYDANDHFTGYSVESKYSIRYYNRKDHFVGKTIKK